MDPYAINYPESATFRPSSTPSYREGTSRDAGRVPGTARQMLSHQSASATGYPNEAAGSRRSLDRAATSTSSTGYSRGDATLSGWNPRLPHKPALGKVDPRWDNDDRSGMGGKKEPQGQQQQPEVFPSTGKTAKRGNKACMTCRRGKNRCEWDPAGKETSCRRCLLTGMECLLDKPGGKPSTRSRNGTSITVSELSGDAVNRVDALERTVDNLLQGQNQIHSTLQQILTMFPPNQPFGMTTTPSAGVQASSIFTDDGSSASRVEGSERSGSPQNTASGSTRSVLSARTANKQDTKFPPLPGFAAPNHHFGTYGIIPLPSAAPSPSHSRGSSRSTSSSRSSYSGALPHETLTAPIQALQALANAADHAAAMVHQNKEGVDWREDEEKGDGERQGMISSATQSKLKSVLQQRENGKDTERGRKRKRVTIGGEGIELRMRKKTRPDPTPRNPFPDVVTKGLVSEEEARELWDIFFSGCHYFVPMFDKMYDTYDTFIERTPFSTNGLLAVAAKIRAGNGPLGETFKRCLEEAQGIARSTLFGPIVRKEAVMAMLILSVWSQNGWLPCGHALRAGLDINLHRALDKLANKEHERTEAEERDLVVSARIWLNCYMHEHLVSLGTGKPLMLRDDSSVRQARELLGHPLASETDMHLIAGVELVNIRIGIIEHLSPMHGKIDSTIMDFVQSKLGDIQTWHQEWYGMHKQRYDDESVLVKLLETEKVFAEMWTVCVALRGCPWDKLSQDQKNLAFRAKDSAWRCLEIFLRSQNFRRHLKYATHDQLVSVAFSAVFLLKIAILYPTSISIPILISQVSELALLLSTECFAERYALTLRLMLANFRRSTGTISTVPGTPRLTSTSGLALPGLGNLPMSSLDNADDMSDLNGGLQSFLGLAEMGSMDIPGEGGDPNAEVTAAAGMGMNGDATFWDLSGLEGFDWPNELSPSSLPVWLQNGNSTDLGLPLDGSDSLFLPPELANMFLPPSNQSNSQIQFSFPDSADVGAEAW